MKRFIPAFVLSLFCWHAAQAGEPIEYGLFNHLAIGASVGTEGYGFDLAMPVAKWAAVRVGISKYPQYKYTKKVDISDLRKETPEITTDEINMVAKINDEVNYKILVDLYPFKKSSFHITGGAYFGDSRYFVTAYNEEPFMKKEHWGNTGVKVGEYTITTDENGIIKANLETDAIKPYVGLGFGRAVPKRRINFAFDMGARFWGEPGIYMKTLDKWGEFNYTKLTKEGLDKKELDEAFDIMSKVVVYPVISFRLSGRIF